MIAFMSEYRWFIPEPGESEGMTGEERAFATALSEASAGLVGTGVSDLVIPAAYGDQEDGSLVASLGISDRDPGKYALGLINFGVHFRGDRVRGGRLHNQLYSLTGETPSLNLEATGSIDELANRTAQWFEAVLRRPIILYVWLNNGHAYAARYAFADTSETLSQLYNRAIAPEGQYEQMISDGHARGMGWIQTAGLPTPDLYLLIRGDEAQARVPAGVLRAEKRGPIAGTWYE